MTLTAIRAAVSAGGALAAVLWLTVPVEGRATARQRFDAAVAAEADLRGSAARAGAPADDAPVLRQARRVLARYETLVRRFPTSAYCDDALFFAGGLAQWLHERTGLAADRRLATKYFEWLVREYPASKHLPDARAAVRTLAEAGRRADRTPAARGPATPVATAAGAALPRPGASPQPRAAAPRVVDRAPAPAAGTAVLQSITRAVLDDTVRVTLALDREAAFTHEVLAGPPRAFVDLFGTQPVDSLQDATTGHDGDAVRQVRVGRRPGALRVVLDLADATRVSVFALYNPFRVVIDADRGTRLTAAAGASPSTARWPPAAAPRPAAPLAAPLPPAASVAMPAEAPVILTGDVSTSIAPSSAPPTVPDDGGGDVPRPLLPSPAPAAAAPGVSPGPASPSANADGSYSLARQLGLGISRIVIDPGHGGHDPGTMAHGTSEARLVLDVALRLEKLLERERFDVVLTRRTDVFVPLEERTAIANREAADLFLSIHANASRDPGARGMETYYLSFASNPEAEAVAARENATSAGGMHNLTSIVRAIALNTKLDESRDLAGRVQRSMAARLGKGPDGSRSRGVKKAPFVVLIGAAMPSVLAEIGFITNRTEAALIKTPAYRQRVAEALHAAVLQYQRSLKRQTTVADSTR